MNESQANEVPCIGVYRREVAADLERVWENVLDWEHLPWLHRESFRSIDCLAEGRWGWRAQVGLHGSDPILLELVIDWPRLRYVARTLEGPGAGTEIWTGLEPAGDATRIEVAFHVPGVEPAAADALGAVFVELYTRLWDQDEVMMQRRTRELAGRAQAPSAPAAPSLDLGPLAEVRAGLPRVFDWSGRRWRLVDLDGELLAHATVCPHALGPLDAAPVESGGVRCPWHGYRFDLRSGVCAERRGLRLPEPPHVECGSDGRVRVRVAVRADQSSRPPS